MGPTHTFDLTQFHRNANGTYWLACPGYHPGPHAHRKRISRRRVHVYQKRMESLETPWDYADIHYMYKKYGLQWVHH